MTGTTIFEIMPDNLSNEIVAAIAEGRLCRYAVELEKEIERLRECLKNSTEGGINHGEESKGSR